MHPTNAITHGLCSTGSLRSQRACGGKCQEHTLGLRQLGGFDYLEPYPFPLLRVFVTIRMGGGHFEEVSMCLHCLARKSPNIVVDLQVNTAWGARRACQMIIVSGHGERSLSQSYIYVRSNKSLFAIL